MPASHPPEYHQRSRETASTEDRPVAAVAAELSIPESRSRDQASRADAHRPLKRRPSTVYDRELEHLRTENRRLELENEILKHAAVQFAHEHALTKCSPP